MKTANKTNGHIFSDALLNVSENFAQYLLLLAKATIKYAIYMVSKRKKHSAQKCELKEGKLTVCTADGHCRGQHRRGGEVYPAD